VLFLEGGCLFCKKTTSGRNFISTNGINNEEVLEENMGDGRGCLFLRCSSKQTTSRGGFCEAPLWSQPPRVEAVSSRYRPVWQHESPNMAVSASLRSISSPKGTSSPPRDPRGTRRRYYPRQGITAETAFYSHPYMLFVCFVKKQFVTKSFSLVIELKK
jgi:hypothetical protein